MQNVKLVTIIIMLIVAGSMSIFYDALLKC